jgi:hypothetical protein
MALIALDIERDEIAFSPVDLIFAGLILEFVDIDIVLPRIRPLLTPGGVLCTVLQMPSDEVPTITPSPFESLKALSAVMRLVSPEHLRHVARASGFREVDSRVAESAGGKRFQAQIFRVGTTGTADH